MSLSLLTLLVSYEQSVFLCRQLLLTLLCLCNRLTVLQNTLAKKFVPFNNNNIRPLYL